MTSPFVASSLNWNLPALFLFRTNFAGTVASWSAGVRHGAGRLSRANLGTFLSACARRRRLQTSSCHSGASSRVARSARILFCSNAFSSVCASYLHSDGSAKASSPTPATQSRPPLTRAGRKPVPLSRDADPHLPQGRTDGIAEQLDAGHPTADLVGDGLVPHHAPEEPAHHVEAHRRRRGRASAHQMPGAMPKSAIAAPHPTAAQMMARPCRCTWLVQPEVTVATRAPTVGAV